MRAPVGMWAKPSISPLSVGASVWTVSASIALVPLIAGCRSGQGVGVNRDEGGISAAFRCSGNCGDIRQRGKHGKRWSGDFPARHKERILPPVNPGSPNWREIVIKGENVLVCHLRDFIGAK